MILVAFLENPYPFGVESRIKMATFTDAHFNDMVGRVGPDEKSRKNEKITVLTRQKKCDFVTIFLVGGVRVLQGSHL